MGEDASRSSGTTLCQNLVGLGKQLLNCLLPTSDSQRASAAWQLSFTATESGTLPLAPSVTKFDSVIDPKPGKWTEGLSDFAKASVLVQISY